MNNTSADATVPRGNLRPPSCAQIEEKGNRHETSHKTLTIFAFHFGLNARDPARAAADESPSRKDVQMVAPALDKYTQDRLLGDVWKRPGLSRRDRSVVTL